MDSRKEIYEIEFTEDARDEIREIYKYISENLVAKQAARDLMRKMRNAIMDLAETPKLYMKIEKKKYSLYFTFPTSRKKKIVPH